MTRLPGRARRQPRLDKEGSRLLVAVVVTRIEPPAALRKAMAMRLHACAGAHEQQVEALRGKHAWGAGGANERIGLLVGARGTSRTKVRRRSAEAPEDRRPTYSRAASAVIAAIGDGE